MKLRNRKLVMIVRVILGLMFLGSGISGLLAGTDMHGVPEPVVTASVSLWSMGIFQMIKVTEIVAGLMLVIGLWPALATIFIAPICVGIVVFDLSVAPQYIVSGLIVGLLTAYLGYAYFDKYRPLFTRN